MSKTIDRLIATANAEVGYKETGNNITKFSAFFDKEHPDFYNTKKQGAAWCDIFVDYCFVSTFGEKQALEMLCQPKKSAGAGCKYSAGYYKKAGRFFDKPEAGDQIFFYVGGEINHTGLVTKVDDKKVYTVEGNSGNAVKAHSYALDNKKIAGYGRPKWNEEANTIADTAPIAPTPVPVTEKPIAKKSNEEIAREVIDGKWGNGNDRKNRLTKAGYDYSVIQSIVNQLVANKPAPAVNKPETFTGIVNTIKDPLRVREGAGTQFRILRLLPKGSKIELYTKKVNGWYKLADGSGYVAANLIRGG